MKIFVTGISTEVGKTIVSAVLVEALKADYWKPVQSGDLDYSDSDKVRELISNDKTVFHENSYALHTPMSPHASAAIDGVEIKLGNIKEPETVNHLVIEGAGGLLVPLNDTDTIFDLIQPNHLVVVVSRHYLGSINHSLLTINALLERGFKTVIVFSGDPHPTTEDIILKKTGIPTLGRIKEEPAFNREIILQYAEQISPNLLSFE